MMPASRAASRGSPFGVRCSRTAATVSADIRTRAEATARRAVIGFALVSTIFTRPCSSMWVRSLTIEFELKLPLSVAQDGVHDQRIPAQQNFVRRQFFCPTLAPLTLRCQTSNQTNQCDDGPVEPEL